MVLEKSGWLPLCWSKIQTLVVDRNFISYIIQIIQGNTDKRIINDFSFWMEFLKSSDVQINPMMCALENELFRIPSSIEFHNEFMKCSKVINKFFQKELCVNYNEIPLPNLDFFQEKHENESIFLIESVPLIVNNVKASERTEYLKQIIEIAHKYNISSHSALFHVVISTLFESHNSSFKIGRKILKPKKDFSRKDAHNVISDLNHLICSMRITLDNNGSKFVTSDKGLVALWCCLSKGKYDTSGCYQLFDEAIFSLFPSITQKQIKILQNA